MTRIGLSKHSWLFGSRSCPIQWRSRRGIRCREGISNSRDVPLTLPEPQGEEGKEARSRYQSNGKNVERGAIEKRRILEPGDAGLFPISRESEKENSENVAFYSQKGHFLPQRHIIIFLPWQLGNFIFSLFWGERDGKCKPGLPANPSSPGVRFSSSSRRSYPVL